jgi:hypothetical protein
MSRKGVQTQGDGTGVYKNSVYDSSDTDENLSDVAQTTNSRNN